MAIKKQIDSKLLACLAQIEKKIIERISIHQAIDNALLIGDPQQHDLLQRCRCKQQHLFSSSCSPSAINKVNHLCLGKIDQLPYAKESIDFVILPHTLEFLAQPQTLLNEIIPILSKKGLLLIFAFFPWNYLSIKNKPFNSFLQIKSALLQAGLSLTTTAAYFSLFAPLTHSKTGEFLDQVLAPHLPFLCNAYFIVAQSKVAPMTPRPFRFLAKPMLTLALENNEGHSL